MEYSQMLKERDKLHTAEIELIKFKIVVSKFCNILETVEMDAGKPIIDAIIKSEIFQEMKTLLK